MITLYSTGCQNCNVLKTKLDNSNIEYILNSDLEKIIELGFRSAPVLDVDGEFMDYGRAIKWVLTK